MQSNEDQQWDMASQDSQSASKQTPSLLVETMKLLNWAMEQPPQSFATCSNAGSPILKSATKPRVVLIDEAGRAKELEILLCVYSNLSSLEIAILMSDSTQLEPTVISRRLKVIEELRPGLLEHIFAEQMSVSLMERFFKTNYPCFML